ncbi:MAG: lipid-binding SYLF domain-containing protein [Candidatus Korobacteraceae bacterium]|jgi:SH3 domain-containing YSC84-like protein 1
MKKIVVALLALFAMAGLAAASERRDAAMDRLQTASTILSQIMSAPDRAIPDGIMSGAKCIAVMPSMLKASFVFGANYGKGVATCRTEHGWSAPAFFKLTGGSFGFQAGGQASDLVLIIRTDDGMQHLLQSKFKLGADASAAAGPVGRDAQAMTDLTMRAQVLTYSRSRGLFLGVSLSGGVIKQDQADTQAFYGKDWSYFSVLNGQVPAPKDAEVLLKTVERYAPTPKPRIAPSPSGVPTAESTPSAQPSVATASLTTTPTAASATTAAAPASSPAETQVSDSAEAPATADTAAAAASVAQATAPAATPASSVADGR